MTRGVWGARVERPRQVTIAGPEVCADGGTGGAVGTTTHSRRAARGRATPQFTQPMPCHTSSSRNSLSSRLECSNSLSRCCSRAFSCRISSISWTSAALVLCAPASAPDEWASSATDAGAGDRGGLGLVEQDDAAVGRLIICCSSPRRALATWADAYLFGDFAESCESQERNVRQEASNNKRGTAAVCRLLSQATPTLLWRSGRGRRRFPVNRRRLWTHGRRSVPPPSKTKKRKRFNTPETSTRAYQKSTAAPGGVGT